MSYIGRGTDAISNVEKLDNITFNGGTTYALTKSSAAFTPVGANNILISIDGVIQQGNFSVSTTNIVFDWSPTSSNTCNFILHYGTGVLNVPADDSVSAAKIASNAVTTAKINADAVTGAKIADDQIDSEHYVDGSIDTAHLGNLQVTTAKIAADAIDGTKLADDAVNSEHYTDASIDNAHLADDAVGIAELSATGTASSSTFLRGDNSWTAVSGTTINNNADNRVITGSGTANTLEGEANLTYDGTTLSGTRLYLNQTNTGGGTECLKLRKTAQFSEPAINLVQYENSSTATEHQTMLIHGHRYYGTGSNETLCINNKAAGGIQFDIGGVANGAENTALEIDSNGHVTMPKQSAFSAYSSAGATNVTGGGQEYTIQINTERFDRNGDFNTGTYTFTAPVTGVYFIAGKVCWLNANQPNATYWDMRMITSNKTYNYSGSAEETANTGNYSDTWYVALLADMDANDTYRLDIAVHAGTQDQDLNSESFMWGHLVC